MKKLDPKKVAARAIKREIRKLTQHPGTYYDAVDYLLKVRFPTMYKQEEWVDYINKKVKKSHAKAGNN